MREPLRITVADEAQARALALDLVELGHLEIHPNHAGWNVELDCLPTRELVIRVLDAVRNTLGGDPGRRALVRLDGRIYHVQGEQGTGCFTGSEPGT